MIGWDKRAVNMAAWAGRCFWATWAAWLAWTIPEVRDPQVMEFALWISGCCGLFVLLTVFCFAMSIWKDAGK